MTAMQWIGYLAIAGALLGGCRGAPPDRLTEHGLAEACDSVATRFAQTLKAELTRAIAEGGLAHAVTVCNVKAPALGAEYARRPGWTVRRVSARNRNPDNAPDSLEAAVLERLAAGGMPVIYQWRRVSPAESTFVYFRAIYASELCLGCHGAPDQMTAELAQVLARTYPADRATGYAAGDLRGAFVVTVDVPPGADR